MSIIADHSQFSIFNFQFSMRARGWRKGGVRASWLRPRLRADRQLLAEGVEELEPAMGVIRRSVPVAVAGMRSDRRAHRFLHPVIVVLRPPQIDSMRPAADEG